MGLSIPAIDPSLHLATASKVEDLATDDVVSDLKRYFTYSILICEKFLRNRRCFNISLHVLRSPLASRILKESPDLREFLKECMKVCQDGAHPQDLVDSVRKLGF